MHTERIRELQERGGIVGREAELPLCFACIDSGRNLMLQGPVGVGKSVLAEALAAHLGRELYRVDGDERYTEQKMTGWFDPALVIKEGYRPEHFIEGPLARAMRAGAILFVNEINRMPESVQNVLLPAMEERRVVIPQYGQVDAQAGFQIVATQNPVEFVATSHLSEALVDRFEFVELDYQSHVEECEIVRRNLSDPERAGIEELITQAVGIVRLTRDHPKVRRGASVRAAIGIVEIASRLGGVSKMEDAARVALLHRIEIAEESGLSPDAVVRILVQDAKKKALNKSS